MQDQIINQNGSGNQGWFSAISDAWNSTKKGAQQAYQRTANVADGSSDLVGGVIDGIGAVSKIAGGIPKIYKGVTGDQMSPYVKYGLAGLGGVAALNTVPGMGLLTSGVSGLTSNAVKGIFKGGKLAAKGIYHTGRGMVKAGKGLKSLSQTIKDVGTRGKNILLQKTQLIGQQLSNIKENAMQAAQKGKNFITKGFQQIEDQQIEDQNYKPIIQVIEQEQLSKDPFRKIKTKGINKNRQRKVIFNGKISQPNDINKLKLMK